MIKVKKLTYGFPAKDLYREISFSVEEGSHCVLIGSNGTGKSTLVKMIENPELYNYDGEITVDENCRIGYASQFSIRDKSQETTVFRFLAERFEEVQSEITRLCDEMAKGENLDDIFEEYQRCLDLNESIDGDNYENNIRRELNLAGMEALENISLSQISGGEYKLLQIMKEMLMSPNLLILDEPDVFLDFGNLGSLCKLINSYKGTMLVITHNRYLLNHCFDKVLHIEDCDLQEFNGSYSEYRCVQLREKLELRIRADEDQEEIQRTEEMVERLRKKATLMVNPTIGRSVNAKQTQLDRLLEGQIKGPFIEVREPWIELPQVDQEESVEPILQVTDYEVSFHRDLLSEVSFHILQGEKVAIVGDNGTGKTTLIKDIIDNSNLAIKIDDSITIASMSQLQGDGENNQKSVRSFMIDHGVEKDGEMKELLNQYCLDWVKLDQEVGSLSLGEQNLLQLLGISRTKAQLLLLDEPTSHLDVYAQVALENAIKNYDGTILMVSHDFYLVAGCADYVLFVEEGSLRRMRTRKFRKMVYDRYFGAEYLLDDRKRQELESEITREFMRGNLQGVDKLCGQLEQLSGLDTTVE